METNQISQLLKKEERRQTKDLSKTLSILISDTEDEDELIASFPKIAKEIQQQVKEVRKAGEDIANQASETKKPNKIIRDLIIAVASYNLVRLVASKIAIADNDLSFSKKSKEAIKDSDGLVERIVSTELYLGYREKFTANWSETNGHYLWNAMNDSRVCGYCEDLDGQEFKDENEVPSSHVSCRCFLEFVKE